MEEYADESCSIVYLCANAQNDIYELYHKGSPPEEAVAPAKERSSLDRTYDNVRTLLDEDQGGFEQGESDLGVDAACANFIKSSSHLDRTSV